MESKRSAPELVRDGLRDAILAGSIGEGTQLRQDQLAEQFGMSRIPVREALRQLEAEGLVKIEPNKGAIVTSLSIALVLFLSEYLLYRLDHDESVGDSEE